MLVRCSECGKPVYLSSLRDRKECGYCYANLQWKELEMISPNLQDWKLPLLEAARAGADRVRMTRWLILLNDSETIKKQAKLQEEMQRHWDLIRAEAEAALRGEMTEQQISDLLERFSLLPANSAAAEWIGKLERALQEKQWESRLKNVKWRLESAETIGRLEQCLDDLKGLEQAAGCAELETEIRDRIEKIRRAEREEQERIARAIRKRRIRKIAIAAACVLLISAYAQISRHLLQPRKLEQARTWASEQQYEEAEKAYTDLALGGIFSNAVIQQTAKEELKALQSDWAVSLQAEGEYERAAQLFKLAGDSDGEARARNAWAQELTAQGNLEEAIVQFKQVPGREDRVRALSSELTLHYFQEENYEDALPCYQEADADALAEQGITELSLRLAWAKSALEKNDLDQGIRALSPVQDDPAAADLWREVRRRKLQAEITAAVTAWEEASDVLRTSELEKVQKLAANYPDIDLQLEIWRIADSHGMDLSLLFPEGAKVEGLEIPEAGETEQDTVNGSRPLVFIRKEKEYSTVLTDILGSFTLHDPEDEGPYDLCMLPAFWQALPPERRAESMADCTVIALVNLTYDYIGNVHGTSIIPDYVSVIGTNKKPTRTLRSPQSFRCFNANHEALIWSPGWKKAFVAGTKTVKSSYQPLSPLTLGPTVDWTTGSSFRSAASLGLAGKFDDQWVNQWLEKLKETLEVKGNGSD